MLFYLYAIYGSTGGYTSNCLLIKNFIDKKIGNPIDNNLGEYIPVNAILAGTFGYVCEVKQINTENFFAMKCVLSTKQKSVKSSENDKNLKNNREYNMLKIIKEKKCVNVTHLIEHFTLNFDDSKDLNCYVFDLYDSDLVDLSSSDNFKLSIEYFYFDRKYTSSGINPNAQVNNGSPIDAKSCVLATFVDVDLYKTYFKQALTAINSLHEAGICHRDIKPDNLLIIGKKLALCDFGYAVEISKGQKRHDVFFGTIIYKAPEALDSLKSGYDEKIDIWSVGVCFIEMLTCEHLFDDEKSILETNISPCEKNPALIKQQKVYDQILDLLGQSNLKQNQINDKSKLISTLKNYEEQELLDKNLLDVLTKCLEFYPNNRPTAKELLMHEYFCDPK